jgi:hypothetical protein
MRDTTPGKLQTERKRTLGAPKSHTALPLGSARQKNTRSALGCLTATPTPCENVRLWFSAVRREACTRPAGPEARRGR